MAVFQLGIAPTADFVDASSPSICSFTFQEMKELLVHRYVSRRRLMRENIEASPIITRRLVAIYQISESVSYVLDVDAHGLSGTA